MAKFEDYLSPEILNKLRNTGETADIDRLAQKYITGESLSSSDIDLLNKNPERLQNALKNKPFTPSSNFEEVVKRLEPSMKMSSETPNISAKLMATEKPTSVVDKLSKQEIQKLASSAIPETSTAAKTVGNIGKLDESMGKLSSLSDDVLSKLGPIGQKIMASKIVTKGLPALGLITEGTDIVPSYRKGKYLDTAADVLGAGASGLALTGVGVPAAAVMGGGSLALHGLSALKENSDIGGAFSDLQKKGVSPYQLARGGGYGTDAEVGVEKFDDDLEKQKKEINNLNQKADNVSPLSEKEIFNLQAPNSSSLPPKNAGPQIPYPMLVPQNKQPVSTTEDLKTSIDDSNTTTEDESPAQLEEKQPNLNQQYQDILNLQQKTSESVTDALKKAQEEDKQSRAMAMLQMGASDVLRGGLSSSYKVALPEASNEIWKEQLKTNDAMKAFLANQEMQKEDPNSPISKRMREIAKPMFNKLGIAMPESISYSEIEKNFPQYTKMFDVQGMSELKKELQQGKVERQKEQDVEKQDQKMSKRASELSKLLEEDLASSRSVFGKQASIRRSADAVRVLINQYKDRNKLDSRQIQEIARSLDNMLSQGSPTVSGTAKLIPKSIQGDIAKMQEYISNIPEGAKQKDFVNRMAETVENERNLADKKISETKQKLLGGFSDLRKYNGGEKYNEILERHGIADSYAEKQKQEEAIKWAKDNINSKDKQNADYAKQILEMHGVE